MDKKLNDLLNRLLAHPKGAAMVEAFMAADKEKVDQMSQEIGEALGLVIGSMILRRKLKKLGFSERERYVLFAALSSLYAMRQQMAGIRKELRKANGGKAAVSPLRRVA